MLLRASLLSLALFLNMVLYNGDISWYCGVKPIYLHIFQIIGFISLFYVILNDAVKYNTILIDIYIVLLILFPIFMYLSVYAIVAIITVLILFVLLLNFILHTNVYNFLVILMAILDVFVWLPSCIMNDYF